MQNTALHYIIFFSSYTFLAFGVPFYGFWLCMLHDRDSFRESEFHAKNNFSISDFPSSAVLYPFLPLVLPLFLSPWNLESGKICCTFAPEITFNLNGESLNKGGIISRRFIRISAREAFCPAGCADLLGNGRVLVPPLQGRSLWSSGRSPDRISDFLNFRTAHNPAYPHPAKRLRWQSADN